MSTDPIPVSVTILDKEYMVSCPPEEKDSLIASAHQLDQRMREVRDSGKVLGSERIAVMTALNLVHEVLQERSGRTGYAEAVRDSVQRLTARIDESLARRPVQERLD